MFWTTNGRLLVCCVAAGFLFCVFQQDIMKLYNSSDSDTARVGAGIETERQPLQVKHIASADVPMLQPIAPPETVHPLVAALAQNIDKATVDRNATIGFEKGPGGIVPVAVQQEENNQLSISDTDLNAGAAPQDELLRGDFVPAKKAPVAEKSDDEFQWTSTVSNGVEAETQPVGSNPAPRPSVSGAAESSEVVNKTADSNNRDSSTLQPVAPTPMKIVNQNSQNRSNWTKNPYVDAVAAQPVSKKLIPTERSLVKNDFFDKDAPAPASMKPQANQLAEKSADQESFRPVAFPKSNELADSIVIDVATNEKNLAAEAIQIRVSEAIAIQCAHHIEYGKSLARRGSSFSARQEFLSALRIIAQSADSQIGNVDHTRCLKQAITAMQEAEDFFVADTESQMMVDVSHVIERHTSPVIDPQIANSVTPIDALQHYFAYAQMKISEACGANPVTAEALHALGKLHTMIASHETNPNPLNIAKSIVFHRAALDADSNNFRSANELGVLLARSGQLEQSVQLLRQSLTIEQTPQAWENLAAVHQRRGETDFAQRAMAEHSRTSQNRLSKRLEHGIQWMSAEDFNGSAPAEMYEETAQRTEPVQSNVQTQTPTDVPGNERFLDKLKRLF